MNGLNYVLRLLAAFVFFLAALSAFTNNVNWNEVGLVAVGSLLWVVASLVGVVQR